MNKDHSFTYTINRTNVIFFSTAKLPESMYVKRERHRYIPYLCNMN